MEKNIFGTDGIRKKVGQEPLTQASLIQLGAAIGTWLTQTTPHATILIGTDTRASAAFVKTSLQAGIVRFSINLYDAHIIPTPVAYALMHHDSRFDLAIIITASHNPYDDNGIKLISQHGKKLSLADEQQITAIFYSQKACSSYSTFGTITPYTTPADTYLDHLRSYFPDTFLTGTKIVLDCANGATYQIAPAAFAQFGADLKCIHTTPNGTNINKKCGSQYPETLKNAVRVHQADIGFAFDGDGDRFIAVNTQGIIKDGDELLGFLLDHPLYAREEIVVGTLMSNAGLAHYAHKKNKQFVRTPVGHKHIIERLQQEKGIIGGEPSGHIVLRDYLDNDDGVFAALRTTQTMIMTQNKHLETFTPLPRYQNSITVTTKKPITQDPLASLISTYEQKLLNGRIVVRYSGTEPVIRVLVEDSRLDKATKIGKQLSQDLEKILVTIKD